MSVSSLPRILADSIPGAVSVRNEGGLYTVDTGAGYRQVTAGELLAASQQMRIDQINFECRARLLARYGDAAEQVSRSLGIYGNAEKDAMQAGIAATIDASNTASDAVLAAANIAAVEAVTVSWPVI